MPNIASILKEEIVRVARKAIRNEMTSLRKAVTTQRADIAELKRRALAAEQQVRSLTRAHAKQQGPTPAAPTGVSTGRKLRFSAKALASNRKRLGLSAEQVGLLVGVGGQSIYNWESEAARPREHFLPALAALKNMGKKEARAQLQAIKAKAEN